MKCPTCGAGHIEPLMDLKLSRQEVEHVLREHNGEETGADWVRKLCEDYLLLREYAEETIRDLHR